MSSTSTAPAEEAPAYVDTSKASIARVYDAFLNGKDNYEIDRMVGVLPKSEIVRRLERVAA